MLLTAFQNLYGTLINPDNLYTLNNARMVRFRGENRDVQKKHAWLRIGKHLTGSL